MAVNADRVATCCETAREGRYGSEREAALDRLRDLYDQAGDDARRRILRTYAEVARNATRSQERERARTALVDLAESHTARAAPVASETLCTIATEARRSSDREAAIEAAARIADETTATAVRETVRETLTEVASEATRRGERERARTALTSMEAPQPTGESGIDSDGETGAYLAQALAEHLDAAVEEGRSETRRRTAELREFVGAHPVEDDAYGSVVDDLESLEAQLDALAGDAPMDADRRERVRDVVDRVVRLYRRASE